MGSKPGRAPTSGTRRGNGPGWGGAAKGAGNGSEPVVITRARVVGPLTDEDKALVEEAKATYVHFMRDMDNPTYALAAAEKLLDRIEGKPLQKTELTLNPLERMATDELERAAAILRGELGGSVGADRPDTSGTEIGKPSSLV